MFRLDVVQTLFGRDIAFSMRTFRFVGEQSEGEQEHTINCQLYLEPAADVAEEQASDCTCYSADACSSKFSEKCKTGFKKSFYGII